MLSSNLVKYSRFPFSNFQNATLKLPINSRPFSTKLRRILNINLNFHNVRDIGKKFQRSNFLKFKGENKTNSLNFAVLGSSVAKIYSGHYRTPNRNWNFFLSPVLISAYTDDQSNSDSVSENPEDHFLDLEFVRYLTDKTLMCKSCHRRIRVDHKLPNIEYCRCSDGKALETNVGGWKPFIERPSGLVWRKEHESYRGLYAYKMYGRLEDVSAHDFLRVQVDTNFRKRWDTSASELLVIEEDSLSNHDIIYWEMAWPKPFANRDYVFLRKLAYEPKESICIMSCVATAHPSFPPKKSSHRVKEYWSYMAIRPLEDIKKPGLEFVVTYFDHPGLSIPSSMSSWVAMSALPTFVSNLHKATLKVSELDGPQPAILRNLLQQLDARPKDVIDAPIDVEESIVLQLDPWLPKEEVQMTPECTLPAEDNQSEEKDPSLPVEGAEVEECASPADHIQSGEQKISSSPVEQVTPQCAADAQNICSEEPAIGSEAVNPQPAIVNDLDGQTDTTSQPEGSASPVTTEFSSAAGESPAPLPRNDCADNEVEKQSKCSETDKDSAPLPPLPPNANGTDQDITGP